MDCSTTGFPVHHQLPELAQTHVHQVGDAIQPSHYLSSPSSSCLQSCPTLGSSPVSHFFTSGGHSIGVSASASVLPLLYCLSTRTISTICMYIEESKRYWKDYDHLDVSQNVIPVYYTDDLILWTGHVKHPGCPNKTSTCLRSEDNPPENLNGPAISKFTWVQRSEMKLRGWISLYSKNQFTAPVPATKKKKNNVWWSSLVWRSNIYYI